MNRDYGRLTALGVADFLGEDSILCLPIGSYEQHGPHLPLQTDTIIAERFTQRLVDTYGDQYDLWTLPSIPYGLSLEHAWAPGTISLRLELLASLLDTIVGEHVRATRAKRMIIVNGHGGNRGALEAALYEIRENHGLRNAVVLHPSSLSTVRIGSELPEVHAGTRETSVMLALAPNDVHLDRLPESYEAASGQWDEIKRLVLDRGTTWPWSTDDPRIATSGIVGGDARLASAQLGESIVTSAIDACETVLKYL